MYKEEEYLMLSGIQHFTFCKRQWALIHIEQQWEENYHTTSGELLHKKAHSDTAFEKRNNIITSRGMRIFSSELGVSGQCDIVEFHKKNSGITLNGFEGKWSVYPVEYKRGKPKEGEEDILQLCAQAMCLEEMLLTEIPEGSLYYGENRRRHKVEFSKEHRMQVEITCQEMHRLFVREYTPKSKKSKSCISCSLKDICLPQLSKYNNVENYIIENIGGEIG